jgi:negative regulator of replication initiation
MLEIVMRYAVLLAIACTSCAPRAAVLPQLIESRRLAAELHVEFTKASEASNRAVMADTDETSQAAAAEARTARGVVDRDVAQLRTLLTSLNYQDDSKQLESFNSRFGQYKGLDDEILPLAVENTNLKAQRLSFGAAREAAAAFRSAVSVDNGRASADAEIGVLDILALQAPHIAEADDAAMTRMETDMAGAERRVREALVALQGSIAPQQYTTAVAAFDRFMTVNAEVVTLSRRNSNVRSLALALGHKRDVTAQCEADLEALGQALSNHALTATR